MLEIIRGASYEMPFFTVRKHPKILGYPKPNPSTNNPFPTNPLPCG